MSLITVRPGETITVIGVAAGPAGPVDPGYSPPWAQIPPGGQGGGPVDPGYSPPWAQVPPGQGPNSPRPSHPIALPGDPWWGTSPPTEPPPTEPPTDGHYVWAWSDQLNRWVWVKVPGEGEAGPKT